MLASSCPEDETISVVPNASKLRFLAAMLCTNLAEDDWFNLAEGCTAVHLAGTSVNFMETRKV